MAPIFAIPYMILNVIWFFIVAHFIMSWLISFNVLNLHQPIVSQIWQGLNRILDPIYSRIRQFIPNMGGLDLAPLVALLIVAALQYTLAYYG
ncbi:MAG: YggT family protein [Rhodobacterales bacterium]|jgi:YggT family protein|uniref:YggT family protein n=1 Tax=uncultured Planktomarina sp. TaxID=1538529 RepID=UPI00325FEA92|tara:strand:+ start:112 stop:387 length:276 start_codon:yes stop_codon:yes gene_type:complete